MQYKIPDFFWRLALENESYNLIQPGDLVYLAISGGRDSICLFYYLLFLRKKLNFELRLAHVNHGLRPDVDAEESKFLKALAASYDLAYEEKVISIPELAAKSGLGIEATARAERQAFFQDLFKAAYVQENYIPAEIKFALGHQKDDLAESMLLQISRGTGLSGLIGMRRREEFYIRPLLTVSRAEITEFLDSFKLPYHDDASNQERDYLRNALRLDLIPLWSDLIGHSIVEQLAKLSANLNSVEAVVDAVVTARMEDLLTPAGELSRRRLLSCRPELQELILHRYIRADDYRQAASNRQMAMILQRIRRGGGEASFDLGANRSLKLSADRIFLVKS
ncbi:MAG: tRNA lysidine(34) synthetase TilS [Eubacteriales bacterium]|nr:tRNA lysidine(34) synthetase TilS [Eubacteriales bacterium]